MSTEKKMAEKYEGEERRRWHIKKEVSLGDLIAFASAALAVVYAYTTLEKRIAILETAIPVQAATDARQEATFEKYQSRIADEMREMNRKLDRLLERGR